MSDRVEHDPRIRPFSELQDEGLLWYINRSCFHSDGYALAFYKDDEGNVIGWSMLGDGSEAWSFTDEKNDAEFAKVKRYFAEGPYE